MTRQRPALDLIADIRRGKVAADLTEELHALIAACVDTGKKGELLLRLTIEPDKNAPQERFNVDGRVVAKTPVRSQRPSLFFVTDDGNLTRTDPRQEAFEGLSPVPDDSEQDGDTASSATSRKQA